MIDFANLNRVLVSDGALGTMLQKAGLQPGECPELWNKTHADAVQKIACEYRAAGADMVSTNTFGGNRLKLREFGLENDVIALNEMGVLNARTGAGEDAIIMASIGPTGQILEDEGGDITEEELYDVFYESGLGFKSADLILCETFASATEGAIALRALKAATNLPTIITFTYAKGAAGYRTMMGVSVAKAVDIALENGASVVGANCGNGIDAMIEIAREYASCAPKNLPIMIQSNAGMPVLQDGQTVFLETPEQMAVKIPALLSSSVKIIGGCCGTTPLHIAAIKSVI